MKKHMLTLLFCFSILGFAQAQEATIEGRVVDTNSGEPIPDAQISIEESIFNTTSDANGNFTISNSDLPQGEQVLIVEKTGYTTLRFPITIESGGTLNFDPVLMEVDFADAQSQIGTISLADDELDEDEGGADNISGLLQASRDVFLNAAAYDFSATFFRPRGLDSENGKVLINGLEMNKMFNGRPQWGNWGGLNDVQRNQVFTMGLSPSEYNFGGLAGSTNIIMRASQYRKGGRVSYAISNRSYTGRVMGSYSSGVTPSGWSYSVLVSRRFAEEGFNDGTLYDSNSFFAAVEKKLSENHSLNLTAFYTPNRRGKSSANTQEMFDIKGQKYNSFWGMQDGEIRNSRTRDIEEPVIMLNHYWDITDNIQLNTNVGYQFGKLTNSRIGYDNAPNPDPSYYQYLPSFDLSNRNPNGPNYESAYHKLVEFQNDGQIDWQLIYETKIFYGGTSRYYLYDDRNDDTQLMTNTILTAKVNENISINGALNYRSLNSKNYASMLDLLGGTGYLDIDSFSTGDEAQSDLLNPNRIVGEGDTFKYNFEMDATYYEGFAQAQFKYKVIDFYLGANASQTSYQRTGLYQNGNFPDNSLGESEKLDFTNYGAKGGFTYKLSGRHLFDVNAAYLTKAPSLRNSFSNSRQNNSIVKDLDSEKVQNIDASYIYRSPMVKARLTGYYTMIEDATEISFYYADGITGISRDVDNAFVQEVLSGADKRHVGLELGVEAQVTSTIKLKAVASVGDYTYANNPDLYLASDDFTEELDFGKSYLENYHLPGGPQRAYQLGFEYRDPDFWWVGATTNYFSNGYVDVSPLTRTSNFYTDTDGVPFNDYNEDVARDLLKQEKFDDYFLVNVVGGKSWKIDDYYIGFFATINNVLDQVYKTGGFEQARNANYRTLSQDQANDTPVFGSKYWYGYGTSYYLNVYVRF
ncbi:MAG: TonB-dependent receptor [Flavobacteriaceae bacterium]